MFLIVGLGNPGSKYTYTRHNCGFCTIEVLSQKWGIPLNKTMCKARIGEGRYGDTRVVLAEPQTFMNLSGESVVELLHWYKMPIENMIVIYDDVDLPLGKIRLRAKGSSGTHNGMRNIIYMTQDDSFPRVRIGIGRPPEGWDMANYVLGEFSGDEEKKTIFNSFIRAATAVEQIVGGDFEAAMRDANAPEKPCTETTQN